MPCQLPDEIATVTDDVFSYMCNLAMEKCSKKADKKKASCGGAAMRKRLLIKNFVAQMLAQDRQTRETNTSDCTSQTDQQSFDESFDMASCQSATNGSDEMEMDDSGIEADDEQELRVQTERHGQLDNGRLLTDNMDILASFQQRSTALGGRLLHGTNANGISIDGGQREEGQTAGNNGTGEKGHADNNGGGTCNNDNNSFPADNHQPLAVGWKSVDTYDDDDFHKVPIPDSHADNLFGDDSASMSECWRLFNDQHCGKKQHQYAAAASDDFPEDILNDGGVDTIDGGKLYFVENSSPDLDERHQLVGLVNMIPSNAVFDGGAQRDFLRLNHHQSPMLTDLDDILCDQRRSRSRKRPWSLVFSTATVATDEALMQSSMTAPMDTSINNNNAVDVFTGDGLHFNSHHPASLLSPLCCGMLQMSPFGGNADEAAAAAMLIGGVNCGARAATSQPMLKRVKL